MTFGLERATNRSSGLEPEVQGRKLRHAATEHLLRAPAVHPLGALAPHRHDAVQVHGHDGVVAPLEQSALDEVRPTRHPVAAGRDHRRADATPHAEVGPPAGHVPFQRHGARPAPLGGAPRSSSLGRPQPRRRRGGRKRWKPTHATTDPANAITVHTPLDARDIPETRAERSGSRGCSGAAKPVAQAPTTNFVRTASSRRRHDR